MRSIAFRLKPGQDLKQELIALTSKQNISGSILTCVGSLSFIEIRMAGAEPSRQNIQSYSGDYEIISLTGTLSPDGVHLHISISDSTGQVLGGHLKGKATVKTTAEVIVAVETDKEYKRKLDKSTGFDEFEVINKV